MLSMVKKEDRQPATDKNGKEIKIGDRVTVECLVHDVYDGLGGYHIVILKPIETSSHTHTNAFGLNPAQVILVDLGPAEEEQAAEPSPAMGATPSDTQAAAPAEVVLVDLGPAEEEQAAEPSPATGATPSDTQAAAPAESGESGS
jgi:hypothetical protein